MSPPPWELGQNAMYEMPLTFVFWGGGCGVGVGASIFCIKCWHFVIGVLSRNRYNGIKFVCDNELIGLRRTVIKAIRSGCSSVLFGCYAQYLTLDCEPSESK